MSDYKGKRIAIIGLSVEGADSAEYFAQHHADVICLDRRTKETLGDVYKKLTPFASQFHLGDSYLSDLESYDLIVRTSGMSLRTPELVSAQKKGIEITSLTKLFFKHCMAPIIGVTGTKGKGTISSLIYDMLKTSGISVHIGGNIGIPLLSTVDSIKHTDMVVLELSSFQLEDLTQSPHIAVVQKITQDHLVNADMLASNFHESIDTYREAKTSIVRYQKDTDVVIVNADDEISNNFIQLTPAIPFTFSRTRTQADAYVKDNAVFLRHNDTPVLLCRDTDIRLRGNHNLENVAASALAAVAAGATIECMQQAVKSFQGLDHRLKLVHMAKNVSYYDDSFSTVPETTIAAIQSFTEPIILIVGGSEKGSDYTQLGKEIAGSRVKVLLLMGDMTKRVEKAVKEHGYKGQVATRFSSMHDIVNYASQKAVAGDIVLLSPACASFDMFTNYKERGNMFIYEVKTIENQ